MRKIVLRLLCFAIILSLIIMICTHYKSNKNEVMMKEINLENIEELMIGSEPPKLLYADKEKVIFDCSGVYVYDMKDKVLTRSFDPSSIDSGLYSKRKWNSFVSQDGKHIIFIIDKGTSNDSLDWLCYSFEDDLLSYISERDYLDYRKNLFECSYLDYKDDLYEKTSGRIVNLSDKEYVYLAFHDWKVSTIQVVYVRDSMETHYSVFKN